MSAAATGNTAHQVSEAFKRVTGKCFCSHHQGYVDADAGSMILRGRVTRFCCFNCQAKARKH